FLSISTGPLCAQKVLYSPYIGTEPSTRFEVIGKAGSYYWVQKSKTKFSYRKVMEPWLDDKQLKFEIYDERMNLLRTIPSLLADSLIKEYLIPADEYFDQLSLQSADQKTIALLTRYTPDGDLVRRDTIAELPPKMKCGDFLLIRSQDKSKILLLGFETVPDSPSRLHAILYDKNWQLLCTNEYSNVHISKPLVQYEPIDYPLENYNSAPVKLGNNGEWLMISSGLNHNYLLFHFMGMDNRFVYKEIK
ncbi:MAG TPA: hypothetical protein VGI82_02590, partial [Chitinophagaceae bacterium]